MHKHNPQMGYPHKPGAFYIIHFPLRQKFPSGNPGKTGDKHHRKRQYHIVLARSQNADKHQCQKDMGKGKHRVIKPHQHLVCPASEIPGKSTDKNTNAASKSHCSYSNQKSGSRAFHHPAENIPPEMVTPEKMGSLGRCKFGYAVHGVRVIGLIKAPHKEKYQHEKGDSTAQNQVIIFLFFLHVSLPIL